jgi:hypothetical protein
MKKKIFEFENAEEWMSCVVPAKNEVPKWYKKMPNTDPNPKFLPNMLTIKSCVPFLDSFLTGYLLTTPVDFAVEQIDDGPKISWTDGDADYLQVRNPTHIAPNFPVPAGHNDIHFTWKTQLSFRLPKGYSALYTHPLNRYDLPFTTLSAVVDADDVLQKGSVPFFMRDGFEGLIPKGTPFAQVVPIKREDWKAKQTPGLANLGDIKNSKSSSTMGFYKKNVWKKKSYE